MKTLVVYYSSAGSNRSLAEEISSRLGADIEEITDGKKRTSPFWMMRSVFEAFLKLKPKIKSLTKNPTDYDLVILCAPIWAQHFASPMMTYIANNKAKFKKLAFACISGGGKNPNVVGAIEKAVGQKVTASLDLAVVVPGSEKPKDIMAVHLSREDLKKDYYANGIDSFIKSLPVN